ncbi:unnamed protein product [Closterium sp. NIES-64]|nr:unnamed protein product [Closterium sp. NIES-64]
MPRVSLRVQRKVRPPLSPLCSAPFLPLLPLPPLLCSISSSASTSPSVSISPSASTSPSVSISPSASTSPSALLHFFLCFHFSLCPTSFETVTATATPAGPTTRQPIHGLQRPAPTERVTTTQHGVMRGDPWGGLRGLRTKGGMGESTARSPSSPATSTASPDSNAAAGGAASGEFPIQSHHTILDVDQIDPTAGDAAAWGGLDSAAVAAAWKRSFLKRVVDTITNSNYPLTRSRSPLFLPPTFHSRAPAPTPPSTHIILPHPLLYRLAPLLTPLLSANQLQTAGWLIAGAATAAVGVQVTAHIIQAIESVPLLASLEILVGAAVTTNVATTITGGGKARERLEQQWDEFVKRVSGTYGLSDPTFDEMESGKDLEPANSTGKETEGEELKDGEGKQATEADPEVPQRKADGEEGEEAVVAVRKAELVRVLSEFVERRRGAGRAGEPHAAAGGAGGQGTGGATGGPY